MERVSCSIYQLLILCESTKNLIEEKDLFLQELRLEGFVLAPFFFGYRIAFSEGPDILTKFAFFNDCIIY